MKGQVSFDEAGLSHTHKNKETLGYENYGINDKKKGGGLDLLVVPERQLTVDFAVNYVDDEGLQLGQFLKLLTTL